MTNKLRDEKPTHEEKCKVCGTVCEVVKTCNCGESGCDGSPKLVPLKPSPSPEARVDWEETIFKIFEEWNSCFETRDDHDDMKRLIKRELQAAFEKGREAR
jgi:hypothetical protein